MPRSKFGCPRLLVEDVFVVEDHSRRLHESGGEKFGRRVVHEIPEVLHPLPVAVVVEVAAITFLKPRKVKRYVNNKLYAFVT